MIEQFSHADYGRLGFELEFQEPFLLTRETVLRLRREFLRAAREADRSGVDHAADLIALVDPGLSPDPYARRQFQKPAPPFVLIPPGDDAQQLDAGEIFRLDAVFLGDVARHATLFSVLLQLVGRHGMFRGEGRFELVNMMAWDAAGNRTVCPIPAGDADTVTVPWINLAWWVDEHIPAGRELALTFMTPARVLSQNRPLFRPTFPELFPFVLRRVTSMLQAWAGIEWSINAHDLIESAGRTEPVLSELAWQDWRSLQGETDRQDLGGVMGRLVFDRLLPDDVAVVLAIGALFNVGKNAAFGCGHYRIDFSG